MDTQEHVLLGTSFSKWHGSVVKTSVFGWRTFPDLRLWLTCYYFVGEVSAVDQQTRPAQPSIPSGSASSNPCNYMNYGGGDH